MCNLIQNEKYTEIIISLLLRYKTLKKVGLCLYILFIYIFYLCNNKNWCSARKLQFQVSLMLQ